ncbi:hypothetical protein [Novosphingobium sp.]|uniref:hypothetical protein n=1 Tax=Novosphingobium sp. TaxID=1874826 RepID=UPI0035B47A66
MQARTRQQIQRISTVLAELAQEVEDLGGRLCADPAVLHKHIADLQAIDLFAQKLTSLSHLLDADCLVTAAHSLRLEELRQRLHPDTLPG